MSHLVLCVVTSRDSKIKNGLGDTRHRMKDSAELYLRDYSVLALRLIYGFLPLNVLRTHAHFGLLKNGTHLLAHSSVFQKTLLFSNLVPMTQ